MWVTFVKDRRLQTVYCYEAHNLGRMNQAQTTTFSLPNEEVLMKLIIWAE